MSDSSKYGFSSYRIYLSLIFNLPKRIRRCQPIAFALTTSLNRRSLVVIALAAAFASLLIQSASASTNHENKTSTIVAIHDNDNSSALLGSLFLTGEDRLTNFNRINETYTEVTYAGNRTIMPTEGVTTAMINATEIGNLTFKLQSNGITFVEGQSILETKGNVDGTEQQENATAMLVDLNGVRPDDPRSSTGVAFFSTNSNGQLAFLDDMIAIYQVKASSVGTVIAYWEWKGADLPWR